MQKQLKVLLATALVGATSLAQAAFDGCRDYFPNNTPPAVTAKATLRDICFDSFAVLHSSQTKTPVFSVEKLNAARIAAAKGGERTNKFYEEARLPSAERATLDDYRGSGFDRGHQAPAGDMPNPNAMAQSFSLANMVPQASENNRGVWAKNVEKPTRQYVERARGDVFVFTGPAYDPQRPVATIGKGVMVPHYLFKLVYDSSANRAWAFWVPNRDDATTPELISYQELVKRTGLQLLPGLNPAR